MAGMSPWGPFPQGSAEEQSVVQAFSRAFDQALDILSGPDDESDNGVITLDGSFVEVVEQRLKALKRSLSWLPFIHANQAATSD